MVWNAYSEATQNGDILVRRERVRAVDNPRIISHQLETTEQRREEVCRHERGIGVRSLERTVRTHVRVHVETRLPQRAGSLPIESLHDVVEICAMIRDECHSAAADEPCEFCRPVP